MKNKRYNCEPKETDTETKETDIQTDIINNPDHYTHGMECIDEMILIFGIDEVLSFCKLNAWKYRKRAIWKGKPEEDIEKSDKYLQFYKELKERRDKERAEIFKSPLGTLQKGV